MKEYFTFTKNQTRAIISLLIAIILSSLILFLIPIFLKKEIQIDSTELESLTKKIHTKANNSDQNTENISKLTPFNFDPNTIDSVGYEKMGLRPKLIHTMLNYRNKGGKYYKKEDVQKMFGLRPEEYEQLEPFIHIAKQEKQWSNTNDKSTNIIVELNTADTSQLIQLKGIGSKLSINIIKYRTQIGGFSEVSQLKEVYGISPETYSNIQKQIQVDRSKILKINLNEITFNELNQHPYFKGALCKEICDLRKKKNYHIENLEELKEIQLINEEIFRKIAPYISVK